MEIELNDWRRITNFKQWLIFHSLTLAEVARRTGISYASLSRYKTQTTKPSIINLEKIKQCINIDKEEK